MFVLILGNQLVSWENAAILLKSVGKKGHTP